MSAPADPVSRFERAKLLHDYFKHLTTVSTWSVVFIATFAKGMSESGSEKFFLAAGIVSFLLCVIFSVAAQSAYIWYATTSEPRRLGKFVYRVGRTGSWITFLAGALFFGIFALKRLYSPAPAVKMWGDDQSGRASDASAVVQTLPSTQ